MQHPVAVLLQTALHDLSHCLLILHHQNRFVVSSWPDWRSRPLHLAHRGFRHVVDLERRALPYLARQFDPALVLLHDPIHRGQPQARSLANFLRREKRLEHSRLRRRIHPAARVRHRQTEEAARARFRVVSRVFPVDLHRLCLNHQRAAAGHRIRGVHHQVHHHLFHHRHVGADHRQFGGEIILQIDFLVQKQQEHLGQVADRLVQVQRLALHRLLPAEGQQLLRQRRRPLRRARHRVQALGLRRRYVAPRSRQLRVALDDRQQVVEIVRHARRQPPHRFHLLRLPQLRLQTQPVGDVVGDEDGAGGVAQLDLFHEDQRHAAGARARAELAFHAGHRFSFLQDGADPRQVLGILPDVQFGGGAVGHHVAAEIEGLQEAVVHVDEAALGQGRERDGDRAEAKGA